MYQYSCKVWGLVKIKLNKICCRDMNAIGHNGICCKMLLLIFVHNEHIK